MINRLTLASWRYNRSSRFSSRTSINSFTSAGAVTRATGILFWQAAKPSPRATYVFPVPDGPSAMTFSRRSIQSQRASSKTIILFSEGIEAGTEAASSFVHAASQATLYSMAVFAALAIGLGLSAYRNRKNPQ